MKFLYSVLITIFILSCTESTIEAKKINTEFKQKNSLVEKETNHITDRLIGTWFVKEILINGKPDLENFPTNNDELTLNKDMSSTSIDRTFNIEEKGTWERISDEEFAVVLEDAKVVFQILKLTDVELETKTLYEGINMVIIYNKEK